MRLNGFTGRLVLEAFIVLTMAATGAMLVYPVFNALGWDQLEQRFGVVLASFRAPALFAAGRGMRVAVPGDFPEVDAFFRLEASTFDSSVIPADYEGQRLHDSYSYMHYYLLYAMGLAWRLFGISFSTLHLLCIFLYAVMTVALYGIFRLATGRFLGALLTLIVAASPSYLQSCPSLRDFGKAPFILMCFFLLGLLLTRALTRRQLILWSILYAFATGIGYGFRQDLLICVPAGLAMLLFFARVRGARHILSRTFSAVILVGVFLVLAAPVIRGVRMDRSSASAQAFAQGVSAAVENNMDFGYASYFLHHDYSDYFDFAIVNSYARRTGDMSPMHGHFNSGHGEAGRRFMREVMRRFPSDMFSRGLASLVSLPGANMVADEQASQIQQGHGNFLRDRASLYRPLSAHFERWGMLYALTALLVLACSNLRLGIAAAFLCAYFGAYPSLLYDFRHYFHLAFIPYWACGYLAAVLTHQTIQWGRRAYRCDFSDIAFPQIAAQVIRGTLFVAIFIAALGSLLVFLRGVQDAKVDRLLGQYERASLETVPVVWERLEDRWLLRPEQTLPNLKSTASLTPFETAGEYLALSLTNMKHPLILFLQYEDRPFVNFSHFVTPQPGLIGGEGDYWLFFPVYELAWPCASCEPELKEGGAARGNFQGISISDFQRHTVKGLYRVRDGNEFPLWPTIAVPNKRDAFLGAKSGAFDRMFSVIWKRVRQGWRPGPREKLESYLDLMRQYPGYEPYKLSAYQCIRNESDPEEADALWGLLLDRFPHLHADALLYLEHQAEGAVGAADRPKTGNRPDPPKDFWSRTRYGLDLRERGCHEDAAEIFRSVVAESPDFMFGAENLDAHFRMTETPAGRAAQWRILHEKHPNAGLPRLFLGIALRDAGELEASRKVLSALVKVPLPGMPEASIHLGAILIMLGQRESGIEMMEDALAAYPDKQFMAEALYADMGRFFMDRGEFSAAIEQLRHAIKAGPDNLWHRVALAEALTCQGEHNAARLELENILRQAPESPYTAQQLHRVYDALGDQEGRTRFWESLNRQHPEAATPSLYLGKALEESGRIAEAVTAYRKAFQQNPDLAEARYRFNALSGGESQGGPD